MEHDMRARVYSLSAGQRDCLRLVNAHLSSKEIARKLNISRHTVDQRIALACRKLEAANRREAAVLLAQYDSFIYEPSDIAEQPAQVLSLLDVQMDGFGESEQSDKVISGIQPNVIVDVLPLTFPFPKRKGDRNDLSLSARLAWAFAIFFMATLVSGAMIAALEVLGRLLSSTPNLH